MKYYFRAFQLYIDFSERARRQEYWYFMLVHIIVIFVLGTFFGISGAADVKQSGYDYRGILRMNLVEYSQTTVFLRGLYYMYGVFSLIPSLALSVRRMHDVGKSGWLIVIPIYNVVLYCTKGDIGSNEYGPDPKMKEEDSKIKLENLDGSEMRSDQLKNT